MTWPSGSTGSHPAPRCSHLLHPHLGEQTQPVHPSNYAVHHVYPAGASCWYKLPCRTDHFQQLQSDWALHRHICIRETFVYQQNLSLKPTAQLQTQKPHFGILKLNIHPCKPQVSEANGCLQQKREMSGPRDENEMSVLTYFKSSIPIKKSRRLCEGNKGPTSTHRRVSRWTYGSSKPALAKESQANKE